MHTSHVKVTKTMFNHFTCSKSIRNTRTICEIFSKLIISYYFVGSKAKGRISKQMLQENKARQVFWNTNIFYTLILKCTYAYQGVRNVFFCWKFDVLCFLVTPEIFPFALLPTNWFWGSCQSSMMPIINHFFARIVNECKSFNISAIKLYHRCLIWLEMHLRAMFSSHR